MNIEVQTENAYSRKVRVQVSADEVRTELDKAYNKVGQKARLPGFRPGRAPRQVLEARFGPGVREDVVNALINTAYTRALKSHNLAPVSRPSVQDVGDFKSGAPFAFTIAVEVRPEVEAQSYTGLKVEWPAWEVTEAEVDAEIARRQSGMARLSTVEGRGVGAGDTVQVELTVRDGDAVVIEEPGTLITAGGDPNYGGIEALLDGQAIDQVREGEVAFAAGARAPGVGGRTLQVTAKVLSIMARVVPSLTDALAEEMGFAGGVGAMRTSVAGQLSKGREEYARNVARANLLQSLIDANPFEVPDGMVEQNLQLLMEEFRLQQAMRGADPKSLNFNRELTADLRRRAGFAAKGAVLLESVSRLEKIEATDADVEAKLEELARGRGQTIEAVRGYFAKDDGIAELKDRILEEKTLDWLLSHAEVTHASPAAEAGAAAEAAPVDAPAAEAPKKKASKKKAAADEAPVEAAPAEAASEEAAPAEAAAEEAPKKKRASKKKSEADEG
jgi:trigger factor